MLIDSIKKLKFLIIIFLLIKCNISYCGINYIEYKKLLNTNERDFHSAYIYGVANGFLTLNTKLKFDGKGGVYCPPEKMFLTLDNINDILDEQVKENPSHKKAGVEGVLLMGLIKTFPCN